MEKLIENKRRSIVTDLADLTVSENEKTLLATLYEKTPKKYEKAIQIIGKKIVEGFASTASKKESLENKAKLALALGIYALEVISTDNKNQDNQQFFNILHVCRTYVLAQIKVQGEKIENSEIYKKTFKEYEASDQYLVSVPEKLAQLKMEIKTARNNVTGNARDTGDYVVYSQGDADAARFVEIFNTIHAIGIKIKGNIEASKIDTLVRHLAYLGNTDPYKKYVLQKDEKLGAYYEENYYKNPENKTKFTLPEPEKETQIDSKAKIQNQETSNRHNSIIRASFSKFLNSIKLNKDNEIDLAELNSDGNTSKSNIGNP